MALNAQEIINYIADSPKKTPVKIYVNLSAPVDFGSAEVFGEGKSRIVFGDWAELAPILEDNREKITDCVVENDRRNSGVPLLDLKDLKARIEPGAIIREKVEIGEGAVIMMGAILNIGAVVGKRTMIDMGAVLGGRATVGDDCHIGAGAVLAGVVEPASATPVVVEDGVLVGANAVVIEGVRIGAGAVVAAGAVVTENVPPNAVVAGTPARIIKMKDARKAYVDHAISTLDGLKLDGLVVAVDCGHGASCQTTPAALQRLGATVHAINTDYCGTDINVECGSTHLEPLRELVLRTHADIGLAHDGDADRVLFVDSEGNEIDGDYILAICGSDLAARGKLANSEIVSTVMCNLGFSIAMKEQGFEMVQTAVGDRYVLERMLADGAVIGGEQSGHIIFLEHNTTGDGLVTALQLLAVLKRTGRTLTDLAGIMKKYPQVLVNVHSDNKAGLDDCQPIWDAVAAAEKELDGRGRILVRPSGTEPLVRVMAEAETHELTQRVVDDIVEVVKRELP